MYGQGERQGYFRMNTPITPYCCVIDCEKDAEWQIVYGSTPDDYTEACTEHVGEMLEPDKENTVYPVEWNEESNATQLTREPGWMGDISGLGCDPTTP